ncbi:probable glycosyltransferase At3g07620 [Lycium ferocissimum]|uniref:probable glycosyltransferase At3g07620 n=1 Tax=Lycium ferocissimum TaxID=112874 RepID=UPI002814AA55|nr:probable glycosyltransferase At3g07620 [Lycium ferocissimum]
MATFAFSLCFLSFLFLFVHSSSSPYLLSPSTFSQNYNNMLTSFKIFIYTPPQPITFSPPSSIFYNFLINSQFITQDPNKAHLFFIPFAPNTTTRSIARLVRDLRTKYPYWNPTLGADHFFISPQGIDFFSDRNALELKKNSIQISVFPTISGKFIPHKDISLPPVIPSSLTRAHAPMKEKSSSSLEISHARVNSSLLELSHAPVKSDQSFLGYLKWDGKTELDFVNELKLDSDFIVESEPSDHIVRRVNRSSKFCLFLYNAADVALTITEAMSSGCVPVVIVDRPIQDLPLTDVLRWSEMAMLIGNRRGVKGLKDVLRGVHVDRYEKMRGLCVAAAHHMAWNAEPQAYDAFYMVMYQLWMRRHTIRYTRRQDF